MGTLLFQLFFYFVYSTGDCLPSIHALALNSSGSEKASINQKNLNAIHKYFNRLHSIFKLPAEFVRELVVSSNTIYDHAIKTQNEDLQKSLIQALLQMRKFTESAFDMKFLDQKRNKNLISLWHELLVASWYIQEGFELVYFRKEFSSLNSNESGEIDLIVKSQNGKYILVEVKRGLSQARNQKKHKQFKRYNAILNGELQIRLEPEMQIEIEQVVIFVLEPASEQDRNILMAKWPQFEIHSFPPHKQRQRNIKFPGF